jgi:hypothetical protein
MKIRTVAALPLIALLSTAPAMAGTLGSVVREPDVIVPIVPVGGLSVGTVAAAVIGTAVVIALIGGPDDTTEEAGSE